MRKLWRRHCSLAPLLYLLMHLIGFQAARAQHFGWVGSVGNLEYATSTAMAVDAAGNVYVTGIFSGTMDFDPGVDAFYLTPTIPQAADMFILKLDGGGNFVWALQVGGYATEYATDIVVDAAGDVVVVGYTTGFADFDPGAGVATIPVHGNSEGFVAKYSSAGTFSWVQRVGGLGSEACSLVVADAIGNVYCTGLFGPPGVYLGSDTLVPLCGATWQNAFVVKLDAMGQPTWSYGMRGPATVSFPDLAVMPATGDVFAAGFAYDQIYLGGIAADGSDADTSIQAGNGSVYLLRWDAAGNLMWHRQWESTGIYSHEITYDGGTHLWMTGYFDRPTDFDPGPGTDSLTPFAFLDTYLLKLDLAGNHVWAGQVGGTSVVEPKGIACDASGAVYLGGNFRGTTDFDPSPGTTFNLSASGWNAFISKFDANGALDWAIQFPTANYDDVYDIAVNAVGDVSTTGIFDGTVDFDPSPTATQYLTAVDGTDFFVHRLLAQPLGSGEVVSPEGWRVSPNPSAREFHLDFGQVVKTASVSVVNLSGQVVYQGSFAQVAGLSLQLPGPAGIYFLRVQAGDRVWVEKLVKD